MNLELYHGTDAKLKAGDVLRANPENPNLRRGVFATSSLPRAESMGLRAALKDKVDYVTFFHFRKNKFFIENMRKKLPRNFYVVAVDAEGFEPDGQYKIDFKSDKNVKIRHVKTYNLIDFIKDSNLELYIINDDLNHDLQWETKHAEIDNFINSERFTKIGIEELLQRTL